MSDTMKIYRNVQKLSDLETCRYCNKEATNIVATGIVTWLSAPGYIRVRIVATCRNHIDAPMNDVKRV